MPQLTPAESKGDKAEALRPGAHRFHVTGGRPMPGSERPTRHD